MVGVDLTLRLNDGRYIEIALLDHCGRIAGRGVRLYSPQMTRWELRRLSVSR